MECRTNKGRTLFTCETRETLGVHMQSDQAICSRCIGTALPSLHSKFVSIIAFIFFRVLSGATLNAAEVVACSDLSSLHSYFSTGIVRLMSPLHNRCHLSVRLRAVQNLRGFSGYVGATCQSGCGLCRICVDSAVTTAKRSKVRTLATHSFVKRSTLCRSLVRSAEGHNPRTCLARCHFANLCACPCLKRMRLRTDELT